nr:hypothetical protein [Tanacetum cinerariifolium]
MIDLLIDDGHVCLSVVRVVLRICWIVAGTDTESEPFKGEARTPESPHIVAPPTCHVEESEGSGTSGARSTSSDSIASLSPDHPLTHTTPVLVPILHRTACLAVCVPPVMSPGLSAGMAEVEAMSDSAFCKRFRSFYDSLPSLTLLVRKRYRGTSEFILGTDSEKDEEVEESLDSDSESEDVEDEGPTTEDEDPTAEDEGLAAGVEGPDIDDGSYGLDVESHGVDDESYALDDGGYNIDEEGHGIESDRVGLGEEEVVPEGQQRVVSVVGTAVSEPLGLGYEALRRRELALEEDHVYSTFEVGQGSGSAPEPRRSERTPPSLEWTSGSLPISLSPYVIPLRVSSPMIPLTVPSTMATSATTISIDEDQFIEVGAQLDLYRGILQDHTQLLDTMPPTLFAEIDKDEMTAMTFGALWRSTLALEAWAGPRASRDGGSCDCVRPGEGP